MSKLNIKTGDTVKVITGVDKGKDGKVMSVNPETGRIVVQNVNMVTRHTKPRRQGQEGGRLSKEGTINVSNVMIVCPRCNKPTRIGHMIEAGKKFRACKKCGKKID
ncbi:MAG: 50S ribosomal protein L24 [Clostridia bacterium]|nr:50S ribosomal protein L24 [Clostridia bacterium]